MNKLLFVCLALNGFAAKELRPPGHQVTEVTSDRSSESNLTNQP